MSVTQQKRGTLSGPDLVHAFLEELRTFVRRTPDGAVSGPPSEIVNDVVRSTTRFAECGDECIDNLSRQLAMSVNAHGLRYNLRYERLSGGRIKVKFA